MHTLRRWECLTSPRKAEGQISTTHSEDLPSLLCQAFLNTNHQRGLPGDPKHLKKRSVFELHGFLCNLMFEIVLRFQEYFSETNVFHGLQQSVKWMCVPP